MLLTGSPLRNSMPPALVAFASFASLLPYHLWNYPQATFLAVALASALSVLLCIPQIRVRKPSPIEAAGAAGITIFLVYVCIIPTLAGGHLKLFVFIPPALAIWTLSDDQRVEAIRLFGTILAISAAPGLVVWLLIVIGVPFELGSVPVANQTMAGDGVRLLTHPLAFFIDGNMIPLPNGGVLFRFAGVFDEPGTVGTLTGLMLAADGFRLSTWREKTFLLAGLASFSLAFLVLVAIGILCRIILRRSLVALALMIPVALTAALTLGYVTVPVPPPGGQSQVSVATAREGPQPLVSTGSKLRQTDAIDNRVLPSMRTLLNEWSESGWRGWAFGIGSDASAVKAPVSQTWLRILTDYGVIGFVLVVGSAAAVALSVSLRSHSLPFTLLFYALFAASAYQRPTIWVPYAMLLLFCAPFLMRGYDGARKAS